MVDVAKDGDKLSRRLEYLLSGAILIAVGSVVLESVPSLQARYATAFNIVEYLTLAIFVPEYLLRLWACVEKEEYSRRGGRLRWATSFFGVIDLFAILPSLIALSLSLLAEWYPATLLLVIPDLRFLRSIRLLRLLKLTSYSRGLMIVYEAMKNSSKQLFACASAILILLLLSACLLHAAEGKSNPDSFGSIPQATWWAVCTLSTVGYGDTCPITPMGKLFASFVALLGIGVFALPIGVISANFMKALEMQVECESKTESCPHCGKKIQQSDFIC